MTAKKEVFRRLTELPANHEFWKNAWMFTRPVFTNESRQMQDPAAFWRWTAKMPVALQRYIDEAPTNPANPAARAPAL